jgi:pSer/pThr/pTyr-binding forkhead associated (FHA) protein
MVQLRILSGKMAGDTKVVRHFPFSIGRSANDDLRLDDPGVWDKHLTLSLQKKVGFTLEAAPQAFAAVNDQSLTAASLHNGDVISFGSAKIQFWLAPAPIRGLRLRDWFVWAVLALVAAAQIFLLCALLQ